MDWQTLFVSSLGIINLLGGAVILNFRERINGLEKQIQDFPNVYARRDDMKEMKREILDALERIENKVERRHEQN